MNTLKFQHPKTKNSLSPVKSLSKDNSAAVILSNVLKNVAGPTIPKPATAKKETKHMEISFSNDAS